MTAIDFPNSPTVGQLFTVGETTWEWTGVVWEGSSVAIPGPQGPAGADGADGADGPAGADGEANFSSFLLMGA